MMATNLLPSPCCIQRLVNEVYQLPSLFNVVNSYSNLWNLYVFLVLELEFEFDVLDDFKSPSPLFSSSPCQFLLESLKSLRVPALRVQGVPALLSMLWFLYRLSNLWKLYVFSVILHSLHAKRWDSCRIFYCLFLLSMLWFNLNLWNFYVFIHFLHSLHSCH